MLRSVGPADFLFHQSTHCKLETQAFFFFLLSPFGFGLFKVGQGGGGVLQGGFHHLSVRC